MESDFGDAPVAAEKVAGFTAPVSVHVVSYRTRLCDIDGISVKAILDGIVHRGILQDDSHRHVASISVEQIKVKNESEEKTVVVLREV